VQMMAVFEFPPRAVCKMRVNLESRKLMNVFPPFAELNLLITFDSARRLLLMLEPSLKRILSAYVRDAPSLPARSTKLS
jgi:hypothetical protein